MCVYSTYNNNRRLVLMYIVLMYSLLVIIKRFLILRPCSTGMNVITVRWPLLYFLFVYIINILLYSRYSLLKLSHSVGNFEENTKKKWCFFIFNIYTYATITFENVKSGNEFKRPSNTPLASEAYLPLAFRTCDFW